jgi:hypothetical protein
MYAALNSDPSDPDVIIKLDISNSFNVLCRQLTLDVLGGKASCDYACVLKEGDNIETVCGELRNMFEYFRAMRTTKSHLRNFDYCGNVPAHPSDAGGGAAAKAGAHPQPHAGSKDNGNGKLLLPQLNRLHLAIKRSQVSPSASSSSQDQQAQQPPKSVIPTHRRVTEQLTKNWAPFMALRQHYAGTRFEEQRQLHLPQKHKATVADSTLRVEMNAPEEQADNAKARDLYWKPLS